MPVPSTISDISDNASINSPAGTDQIAGTLDDYLRAIQAILKKQFITGGSIAASATLPVPAAGAFLEVTGAATIQQIANSFDGRCVILRFAAGSTLQHSSALIMPGGASITTQANDAGVFVQTGAGTWTCAAFSRSLNSDMVDGYHAGNASGHVAVSNGTVCTNLNADLLDGQHGAYYATAAAVAAAQSTADGKASKLGDTFTGGITVSAANAQMQVAATGFDAAIFFNQASGWGLYSNSGGSLVQYDRATGKKYFAGVDSLLIVQNNGGTYGINISGTAANATNAASAANADTVDGWHADPLRTWGNLIGRPTTIAGYGITDMGSQSVSYAASAGYAGSAGTASSATQADGLAASPGGAPHYACRGWVNFNGTGAAGANQVIRGGGNVASVYKNGAGDYTINFAVPMPDTNYCVTGAGSLNFSGANAAGIISEHMTAGAYTLKTASAVRIICCDNNTDVLQDAISANVNIVR